MPHNKNVGFQGENIACDFLIENGYKIIEKNFSIKIGEIDIIARKDNYIIFVEVKARRSRNFGYPRESVTLHKQNKLKRIAEYYILINKITDSCFRFDVIEIIFDNNLKPISINLIDNAFC